MIKRSGSVGEAFQNNCLKFPYAVKSEGYSSMKHLSKVRLLGDGFGVVFYLYTASIILEGLLYFKVVDVQYTGIGITLGRLFQVFVLIGLFVGVVKKPFATVNTVIIDEKLSPYFIFVYYCLLVSIVGVLTGKYDFEGDVFTGYNITGIVNSPYVRPFVEFFIVLYWFFYFVVIAPILINSREKFSYVLKVFFIVIVFNMIVGWLDLFSLKFINYDLVAREMVNDASVGTRFHGFGGEPRSAFVFLIASLFVLYLRGVVIFNNNNISRVMLLITFLA